MSMLGAQNARGDEKTRAWKTLSVECKSTKSTKSVESTKAQRAQEHKELRKRKSVESAKSVRARKDYKRALGFRGLKERCEAAVC